MATRPDVCSKHLKTYFWMKAFFFFFFLLAEALAAAKMHIPIAHIDCVRSIAEWPKKSIA